MSKIVRLTLFLTAPVFCQTFKAPSLINEAKRFFETGNGSTLKMLQNRLEEKR